MAECGEYQDAPETLCAAACGELRECVLGAQYADGSLGEFCGDHEGYEGGVVEWRAGEQD